MLERRRVDLEAAEEVERLAGDGLHALLAYGSHVAGYARPESDHDYVAVLDGFKPRVRYRYEDLPSGAKASILLVDKAAFEKDVDRAYLGEFVAGRLFSVYAAMVNEEYLTRWEKLLKIRAISEELKELYAEFREFVPQLFVPHTYFLFSKLRKRMSLYPPVKYSYQRTFFGPAGEENVESSLRMFRAAAEELASKEVFECHPEGVVIPDVKSSKVRLDRFLYRLNLVYRGVKSYLVHGWSARVSPRTFVGEFYDKFVRELESSGVDSVLSEPYRLLGVRTGDVRFYYDEVPLADAVKDLLGSDWEVGEKERTSGVLSHLYKVVACRNGESVEFAYKRYSYVGRLKWYPVSLWTVLSSRYRLSSSARFSNEFEFLSRLREEGFSVPVVRSVMWSQKALLMDYVEGEKLSDVLSESRLSEDAVSLMRRAGSLLASVHSRGIVLGDAKPQNVIVESDGSLCLTDLEQAGEDGDPSWDVAMMVFYGAKFAFDEDKTTTLMRSFLEGYLEEGDAAVVRGAVSLKHVRVFAPLVPPQVLKALVDLCRSF